MPNVEDPSNVAKKESVGGKILECLGAVVLIIAAVVLIGMGIQYVTQLPVPDPPFDIYIDIG